MEEDRVKGETEAAKAPVDSTTLRLHNLLYEKNHYVKAIRSCLDFQTRHPGIQLVPEEEFRRAAPRRPTSATRRSRPTPHTTSCSSGTTSSSCRLCAVRSVATLSRLEP
jgi:hypothetical protein